MFEVQYFTLDATDATNQYISLNSVPAAATNVAMDLIGGTAQMLNGDFGVDGTRIKWDGTFGLNPFMNTGDLVRVIYDKS